MQAPSMVPAGRDKINAHSQSGVNECVSECRSAALKSNIGNAHARRREKQAWLVHMSDVGDSCNEEL